MPVEETGFLVRTKYEVRENGKVKKMTYSAKDVDYFMTEFNGKFYMFPVFGTVETKFWTVATRLSTQKQAKDFKAEDILSTLRHAEGHGFKPRRHRQFEKQ